jgi:hypothetical protein
MIELHSYIINTHDNQLFTLEANTLNRLFKYVWESRVSKPLGWTCTLSHIAPIIMLLAFDG